MTDQAAWAQIWRRFDTNEDIVAMVAAHDADFAAADRAWADGQLADVASWVLWPEYGGGCGEFIFRFRASDASLTTKVWHLLTRDPRCRHVSAFRI